MDKFTGGPLSGPDLLDLTTIVAKAYISNNSVPPSELATLVHQIHAAFANLSTYPAPTETETRKPTPAQIRKSIGRDALISFIDGKSYKMLKRHLAGNNLTIEQYRVQYGLPHDYPTTAPGYSEERSALAKRVGLGRRPRVPDGGLVSIRP